MADLPGPPTNNIIDLGSDSSSDVDIPPEDLPVELCNALEIIADSGQTGSFAHFAEIDEDIFSDPQIHVDGVGKIHFPLSEEDAKALISACHQAPFGKGSETLVDPSVRKTWEMDPSHFKLENPRWERGVLPNILKQALAGLGIEAGAEGIQAQLYKMLLYEKGAHFKAHQDTEKTPGMFGTLVICLPSEHQGGEVCAKMGKVVKVFSTSKMQPSFACWYSDVKHEVKEVTSGYRWVLTYNLVNTSTSLVQASLPALEAGLENVRAVLKGWRQKREDAPRRYVYVLQHEYTDKSLRLQTLKGGDLAIASVLEDLSDEMGFSVFLASIANERSGPVETGLWEEENMWRDPHDCFEEEDEDEDDDEDEDEDDDDDDDDDEDEDEEKEQENKKEKEQEEEREKEETPEKDYHDMYWTDTESFVLDRIIDLTGTPLIEGGEGDKRIEIHKEEMLQEDAFAHIEPDEDDLQFTGNEGATATHWYKSTAIVIMPRDEALDFLSGNDSNTDSVAHYLRRLLERRPGDAQLAKKIRNILREKGSDAVEAVVQACINLEDVNLLNSIAAPITKPMSTYTLSKMSHWVWSNGFHSLRKGLERLLPETYIVHEWHNFLQSILGPNVNRGSTEVNPEALAFRHWVDAKTLHVLERSNHLYLQDVEALVEIVARLPLEYNASKFILKHASNTPVIVNHLDRLREANGVDPHRISDYYQDMLSKAAPVFSLLIDPASVRFKRPGKSKPAPKPDPYLQYLNLLPRSPPRPEPRLPPVDGEILASVVTYALKLGLTSEVDGILRRIEEEAEVVDVRDYQLTLIPFLNALPFGMKAYSVDESCKPLLFNSIYQAILRSFLRRYVGKEPILDWVRPPAWYPERSVNLMNKDDFRHLCEFLQSPNHIVARFAIPQYRLKRLPRWIPSDAACRTVVDHRTGDLVVTKDNSSWRHSRAAWQKRCEQFDRELQKLQDCLDLKTILEDHYEMIVLKVGFKAPEGANLDTGVQPSQVYVAGKTTIPPRASQLPAHGPTQWATQGMQLAQPQASWPPIPQPEPRLPTLALHAEPANPLPPLASSAAPPPTLLTGISQAMQPLATTTGNVLPPLSSLLGFASDVGAGALKNTEEMRAGVKRKAAESGAVDLTSVRNTEETRRNVKQKVEQTEVLDLTDD